MTAYVKNLTSDVVRPTRAGTGMRGNWIGAGVVGLAMVLAVAVNAVVAALAGNLGAEPGFLPLTLPVYGGFTVVGVVLGWLGWRMVQRRATRPRAVLTVLVPVVTVLSMVPDLLLLALHFIPGTNAAGAVALMAMHVVVVVTAVPGYVIASRFSPRAERARTA